MKLALALLTKDKPELTRRSIEPLLQPDKFSLYIMDGSADKANEEFALAYPQTVKVCTGIRGGPDAAIVHALTWLLDEGAEYVGTIEQDVLLHPDWLGPTMGLFERGQAEGLKVGAVSARSYEDRILVQRDGYALMHNLGAGHVIFTREAARIILDNYRTGWWTDNRLIFCRLSGIDIGQYAAFRGNEQYVTADWNFDAVLARHGLASLALTPSLATMLDQDIASQGLKMADPASAGLGGLLRNEDAFAKFCGRTMEIRMGDWILPFGRIQQAGGTYTYFPHQIPAIGGTYSGDWRLKWCQGFGPFVWEAGNPAEGDVTIDPTLEIPILGPCEILLGGTGQARVTDTHSGYSIVSSPADIGLDRILQVAVPAGVAYRIIKVEALTLGIGFYGIRTREPQPWLTHYRFDHSQLPKVTG